MHLVSDEDVLIFGYTLQISFLSLRNKLYFKIGLLLDFSIKIVIIINVIAMASQTYYSFE